MKRSAAIAWRLVAASQNPLRPSSKDRATTAARGSSTMRLSHSVATPMPRLPVGSPVRRGRGAGKRGDAHLAVDTPASSSIFAIEPFSGSNISSLTFDQPPRSSIVNRPDGSGNSSACLASTASLTGR